jgi:hypothetical protein
MLFNFLKNYCSRRSKRASGLSCLAPAPAPSTWTRVEPTMKETSAYHVVLGGGWAGCVVRVRLPREWLSDCRSS